MARKDRIIRRIDEKNDNVISGGGEPILPSVATIVAPNVPSVPEPENITVVSETLLRTTYVPKSLVGLAWDNPPNLLPELYQIEAAKDVNFTTGSQIFSTTTTSGVIELNTNTGYWFRVRGVVRGWYGDWGYLANYPTVSYTTMDDTTSPNPVTGVATDWTSDDLEFTWTNPSSSNYFDARIRLYDTFGGTLFKEVYVTGSPGGTSRWIFRLADNYQVTAGSPLTSVYYEIYARSLAHVLSASAVTGTVTKAPPSKPTGVTDTWSGDNGTYDEGVTISWNAVTGAKDYLVTVDGLLKVVTKPFYTYDYSQNVADHRPTLVSGDFSIAYTVRSRNGLGQTSGGASGTALNIAPQSSNLTLATVPGFSSLYAYVTPAAEIKDLYGYRWTLSSGGATVQTTLSFTPEVTFTTLNGSYLLSVYAIDLFGQRSTAVSGTVSLDGLTIAQLRAETQYTNSIGTSPTTLNGLKDNDLLTSVVTITSGTAWKWTKAERPLLDRYRTVTLAVSGAATNLPVVYFGISSDDSSYRWFAGPLSATGTTGQTTTLTEHASEVIAQASGVLLTTNINRFDFPSIVEGRYVKMGHRGNIHNLAEYYPRRIVQSDDMEAETIKAINIAAATITADRIAVFSLTAGTATISGVITIGTLGGIWQGTGTFASPTTGIKLYNTGGIGQFTTYSGGVAQVSIDTLGRLTAGAGQVILDQTGINITGSTTYLATRAYGFVDNVARTTSDISSIEGASAHELNIRSYQITGKTTFVNITADAPTGKTSGIDLEARVNGVVDTELQMGSGTITMTGDVLVTGGGLNVNAVGASTGQIRVGGASNGLVFEDRSGSNTWQWYGTGDVARLYTGSKDTINIDDNGTLNVVVTDAVTNTVTIGVSQWHRSTGTVAASFGLVDRHVLESDNGADREASRLQTTWVSAVDASRKARTSFLVFDTAQREILRGEASGTAPMIGFFGGNAAAKQTVTGTRTGTLAQLQTVVANMLTALSNYGLWTDSTT